MTAQPMVDPAADRLRGAPALLTQLGILLLFAVPPALLDLLGLGYMTPSGSAVEKVHPGTDLLLLAFAWSAARAGNPLRVFVAEGRRFPGVAVLMAAVVLLIVYLAKVQKAPFTPVIDTFVMPAVLFVLLVDLPGTARRRLERGLHVFLAVNAILGIAEFIGGWRLIPMQIDGVTYTTEMEWRASGLLGHPLSSATTAGLYAVILALGFGPSMPSWLRGPALTLQVMSLAAFGGRTALVLTLLCLAALVVVHGTAILAGRRFDRRGASVLVLVIPLVFGALSVLASSGFFDQMAARFVDDNGSAKSRAIIFDVFSYLSWQEILLGPDQDHVASILHLVGIEVGVESFWLGCVILCGAAMSCLLFIALGCFMAHVMSRTHRLALIPLVYYVVFISTTISLSAKSASLGQFITLLMILMPRAATPAYALDPSARRTLRHA